MKTILRTIGLLLLAGCAVAPAGKRPMRTLEKPDASPPYALTRSIADHGLDHGKVSDEKLEGGSSGGAAADAIDNRWGDVHAVLADIDGDGIADHIVGDHRGSVLGVTAGRAFSGRSTSG